MTATHAHTCTVLFATGRCGKPAIYTEREFAECAECAAVHGSLYSTRHMASATGATVGGHYVGEEVKIHRYGKTYWGTVVHVGARGAAYAEFTYGNGATRRVRVED